MKDPDPMTDEMLTIEEIEARFAPDWVLIGEPQTDEDLTLLAGKVHFHSPDRDEVYRKARELRLDRIAVRYLGTWPDDMTLVLWRGRPHHLPVWRSKTEMDLLSSVAT